MSWITTSAMNVSFLTREETSKLIKTFKLNQPLEKTPAVALTIGNFDGCHIGHQQLIKETIDIAKQKHWNSAALTFNPTAKDFFTTPDKKMNLFTDSQKVRAFTELGLNFCHIKAFDSEFAQTTHQDFIEKFLRTELKASSVLVGHDFRFGHNRQGHFSHISQAFNSTKAIEPVHYDNVLVSSTVIRNLLIDGNIELANKMLKRPYLIEGTVVKGKQLGRTIGIPTANFSTINQLTPKQGVYCGYVAIWENDGIDPNVLSIDKAANYFAVCNIGRKPTVQNEDAAPNIEVHIINKSWDPDALYEKNICFYFIQRLRDEIKFPNINGLKKQIFLDILQSRKILEGCEI